MTIGGWQKFSLLDYPEKLSAIVFTQGCNFRCQFCYNPMLVEPNGKLSNKPAAAGQSRRGRPTRSEDDLFAFLAGRRGKLDAVVISGGEPTLQPDLPDFLARLKELGYLIKLDTNGTNPELLARAVNEGLVDYLAMDFKAPFAAYERVAGVRPDLGRIKASLELLRSGRLPYEFRTTAVPGLVGEEDIAPMGENIRGARLWFIQKFKADSRLINRQLEGRRSYSDREMESLRRIGQSFVKDCRIR